MSSSKLLLSGILLAGFLAGCGPATVEPELSLSASPRTLDGVAQKAVIKITAVDDKAKPGTGKVRVTSVAGSLKDGVEVDLLAGEGSTELACERATDAACTGTVKVNAEWVVSGKLVTATTSVTVTPAVVVVPDAGVTLTSSRTQVGIGLGATSDIVATYTIDGVAQAGAPVTMSTSEGRLLLVDGGAFVSPATTDTQGKVNALLAENGVAGTATITAAGPTGRAGTVSVNIYRPDAGITLTSDRQVLTVGFNQFAQLTVNHTLEGRAVPGRLIQLETTAGELREVDGGAFTSPAPTDASGRVRALLTDTGSPGMATVTASDLQFNVSARTTINIAQPDAGVFVTTGKSRIYVGIGDSTPVTARLVTNGTPAAGRTLQVATNLGSLNLPDGGAFSGSGTTDSNGTIPLELREGGVDGVATITATDPQSTRTGTATVDILRIGTITYTATLCGGTACTLMGIRNSGFNTQATIRFTVKDSRSTPQPVSGVRVAFTLNSAPGGTQVTANGTTDAQGNVDATVNSGDSIGSYSVTATVIAGISATSPTVGVRGATPTSKGFQFQCAKNNLAAYRGSPAPLALTDACTIILIDRNNNPIGAPTTVQFLSEAGSITSSIATTPYVPPLGTNEGRGSVVFDTAGTFPPQDVPPFVDLPSQFPFPRESEPQRVDGSLTRNPRDGLVTVIAYTNGEEWFTDSNSNGVCDGAEQFIDQGEPLVDANDNDVWDPGENYIDVDTNGAWTPPNGVWNASTKIWTKTLLLYTNAGEPTTAAFVPSTFNVAKGTTSFVDVYLTDLNRNVVEAGSTATFTRTGTKGSISLASNLTLDGYGFQVVERRLTNPSGTADCLSSDPVCEYHTVFGTWSAGPVGRLTIVGAALTDVTAPESVTVTVGVSTRALKVDSVISGTVQ